MRPFLGLETGRSDDRPLQSRAPAILALADIELSARRKAEGKTPAPISPLALEIVQHIDALFEIERGINGKTADDRHTVRQELSRPLIEELEARMRAERPKLSRMSTPE